MIPELAKVREKYPQYKDIPDDQLADALAAKYPQYSDLPKKVRDQGAPQEESLLGKAGSMAKEFISAPYSGNRPTDFMGAITRPITETASGLYDIAKQGGTMLLPPFMRPKTEKPTIGEAAKDIGAVITALNPEIIPILQGAGLLGEAVYGASGSPLAAGITENVASLLTPGSLKKIADKIGGKFAASDAAKAAKYAEQTARVGAQESEIAKAGQGVAKAGEKTREVESDIIKAMGGEARATSEASIAAAKKDYALEQVKKRQEEAAKLKTGKLPAAKTTTLEFGEQFTGPEFQKAGEAKGYYPEAKARAKEQAKALYNEAYDSAAGKTSQAAQLAEKLKADLESKGIAVEVVPTRAEMFGKKLAQKIDPVQEADEAYKSVRDMLTQEQYNYLATGRGPQPGAFGSGVPAIPTDVVRYIGAAMQGAKGKSDMIDRFTEIIGAGKVPALTEIPASDAMILRQRLNAAIRAAENSKRFDIAHELKTYKGFIEESLPAEVLSKLKTADRNYVERYIKYFGPDAELARIVENKNPAKVFDAIVSKDDPLPVRQAMEVLSPEGQRALQGAFYHKLYNESVGREGVNWREFVNKYDSYAPEVKQALLGNQAPAWDKMVANLHDFQSNARINLKASVDYLKAAEADTNRQIANVKNATQIQTKALGKRETAAKGYEQATKELQKQRAEMVKLKKEIEEANKPQFYKGGYLEARKRMLFTFAAIDIGKWTLGIGTPNILKYGIGDLASLYIISNPKVMTEVAQKGGAGVRILSDYISTNYADPSKLQKAIAVFNLAQSIEGERK